MNSLDRFYISSHISKRISLEQEQVDHLILATPTGEIRNALTDLNLHLLQARTAAVEAMKLLHKDINNA